MANTYRVEKVDVPNYTEEDWKQYFEFRLRVFAQQQEASPFASWRDLKYLTLNSFQEKGEHSYMVWKNELPERIIVLSVVFKDDLKRRFTTINNGWNEDKIEVNLLRELFPIFINFDEYSNALALRSKNGLNDYVHEKYSAKLASVAKQSELNIKEANIDKINSWLLEAPVKFPDFEMRFYDEIPEEMLEEYAAMFTQMLKDMPANSMIDDPTVTADVIRNRQETFKVKDYGIYSYLVLNETSEIIAKTHVSFKRKSAQRMTQHMTGVKKEYRGLGLSKWIKAAMFKKLVHDFPELEILRTETHPDNHASRELSKQMGYKQVGTSKEFLIERTTILQHLGQVK